MEMKILETPQELGREASRLAAEAINSAISRKGEARIVLSTGSSQFETLDALIMEDVDWPKVEMFHLDEYIGLTVQHPASFRMYLQERFISKVALKKIHLVDGEGNFALKVVALSDELKKAPIDLALIGIGENAHIAFNDPPADFTTKDAYIIVKLDDACKRQQIGEGWFRDMDDVPNQAISMSVYQIMQSEKIISAVPHKVKAQAIKLTLESDPNPDIPATILKTHTDWTLLLDRGSASKIE